MGSPGCPVRANGGHRPRRQARAWPFRPRGADRRRVSLVRRSRGCSRGGERGAKPLERCGLWRPRRRGRVLPCGLERWRGHGCCLCGGGARGARVVHLAAQLACFPAPDAQPQVLGRAASPRREHAGRLPSRGAGASGAAPLARHAGSHRARGGGGVCKAAAVAGLAGRDGRGAASWRRARVACHGGSRGARSCLSVARIRRPGHSFRL
mmetsp:Transcript_7900/g.31219  ORF Transcript_7900/g.31219 Transcript_7900/m.31219 type:complete len:209 (+) Transcript_7900:6713-7339(+)